MTKLYSFLILALATLETLFILFLVLTLVSCAHSKEKEAIVFETVANCMAQEVQDKGPDLVPEVQGALLAADWRSSLLELAKRFGTQVVGCVVDSVVRSARDRIALASSGSPVPSRSPSTKAGTITDKTAEVKAERGSLWLEENRIRITNN